MYLLFFSYYKDIWDGLYVNDQSKYKYIDIEQKIVF